MGHDVVVIGGGLVGLELGEFLAERGRSVTVLEAGAQAGLPMAMPRRWTAVRRATDHGVTVVRRATVTDITPTDVGYRLGDDEHRAPATEVVIASEVRPAPGLRDELAAIGVEVHVVGDASDVRYIEGAMHSAWAIASAL